MDGQAGERVKEEEQIWKELGKDVQGPPFNNLSCTEKMAVS